MYLYCKKEKTAVCELHTAGVVEHRGLEPLTPTLPVSCAPSCANAPWNVIWYYTEICFFITCTTASAYRAACVNMSAANQCKQKICLTKRSGGPEETRTLYLYVANVALSQVSYRPVWKNGSTARTDKGKQKWLSITESRLVRAKGLEPILARNRFLRPARLPIPPRPRDMRYYTIGTVACQSI